VGAHHELKMALSNLDQFRIDDKLKGRGIRWHFNPPYASYMGESNSIHQKNFKSIVK